MAKSAKKLKLIDYKYSPTSEIVDMQQLPRFEVRYKNEVLSQGRSPIEAWERCAEFLLTRHFDI